MKYILVIVAIQLRVLKSLTSSLIPVVYLNIFIHIQNYEKLLKLLAGKKSPVDIISMPICQQDASLTCGRISLKFQKGVDLWSRGYCLDVKEQPSTAAEMLNNLRFR